MRRFVVAARDAAFEEVHRRRADEAGDEQVGRPVVEIERGTRLFHDPVMHDDDAVGHGHRLDLVVRDIDARGLQPLMQLPDLGAHLDAQLGVEVAERLVEQEHLGIADDGPAHGDALALAAGELSRIAVEVRLQAEDAGGATDPLLHQRRVDAAQLQAERHVVDHLHVRIERVVLEHHRDVAFLGRQVVDHPAANRDLAARDLLEPGDHAQQRRFSAAARADQDDELAIADRNVDAMDDPMAAEPHGHVADFDRRHSSLLPPSASNPAVGPLGGAFFAERLAHRPADGTWRRGMTMRAGALGGRVATTDISSSNRFCRRKLPLIDHRRKPSLEAPIRHARRLQRMGQPAPL